MSKREMLERINEITDQARKENRDLTESEAEEAERLTDAVYDAAD
jgi:uncharacterized protein YnzC (UPF0291/DUF896 family)